MMSKEQEALFSEDHGTESGPVECLGRQFASDAERREYFRDQLRLAIGELDQHLGGVGFQSIEDTVSRLASLRYWRIPGESVQELANRIACGGTEKDLLQRWKDAVGFPHGSIDAIIQLSDPPYYTACPNPFLVEFVERESPATDEAAPYVRTPLTVDVSEGKNDRLYKIPSYHTKVPPAAIQQYLLHYSEPGDLVLDAFCGTGMTGVAGLQLGQEKRRQDWKEGGRRVILCDLSPAATFTASVMNAPLPGPLRGGERSDLAAFARRHIMPLYEAEFAGEDSFFDYAIWSEWGECEECGASFRLFDVVIDWEKPEIRSTYPCPSCSVRIKGRHQKRAFTTEFDSWLGRPARLARTSLVMVSKRQGNRAIRKDASTADVQRAEELGERPVKLVPMELPYAHMTHERNNLPEYWGITHIHHFYTRRNYLALSELATIADEEQRRAALFAVLTILDNNATRRNRFYVDRRRPNGSPIGPLSNTLYVPSLQVETNIGKKVVDLTTDVEKVKHRWVRSRALVSTQSASALLTIPSNSIDFVFTDPPFGGNINYSEQNLLAEWWLQVFTNNHEEAITNPVQRKGITEYHELMRQCFREYYRVVKPGRWMVVEFHNSSNAVWIAIQRALEEAGWVVGGVTILDKVHSTLHQDHKPAAVDKDLAIAVYKPTEELTSRLQLSAGSEEAAWDFVALHLRHLPILFEAKDGMGTVSDRQPTMLYDRMVAFHVSRGIAVPLAAAEFYAGLAQRFPERDGMYFLPEQLAEYDRHRAKVVELAQLDLFVSDEASAIHWVRQQLQSKPQSFQELQPPFLKELQSWAKHERTVELREILEQNFLRYDGQGPVPSQIHAYLSSNFRDLRGLGKDDPRLVEKAKDRWFVPDPRKQGDLEKLRERALLKEFEEYKASRKKLKAFRTEAIRAGFKASYDAQDYKTIIEVATKIPESVLQEDEKLLMYYDVASMRLE